MTIFAKIISGEISTDFVYEDDQCVAFKDQNPQAPTHILVVPREPIPTLGDAVETHGSLLGHLMLVATKIAKEQNLESGFRVVVNNGPDACQSVYHLHIHLMGGRGFSWPPG